LRRHIADYLEPGARAGFVERERIYVSMLAAEQQVASLDPKFARLIRQPEELREQLARAHRQHERDETVAIP
jgi:tellurite resistance protein TerC